MRSSCVVMFIGPPGSGKGTQASIIEKKFSFTRIETGNILREIEKEESERGRKIRDLIDVGRLAPPPLTAEIVIERTRELVQQGKKVVFDGSPRTLYEAECLYAALREEKVDNILVIVVDVPKEETIQRIVKRWMCSNCGAVVTKNDDSGSNSCDICGGELSKRADDTPEVMERRWREFMFRTKPVISFFAQYKLVRIVNGSKSIKDIELDVAHIIQEECK